MRDSANSTGRKTFVDATLLFAFALILRLVALTLHPLWTDEAITVFMANMDFSRLLRTILTVDINPPLHYLYLWGWRSFGEAVWVARLSSAIPGALSVALVYLLGLKLSGRFAGLFAGLLLAVTPLHIYQSNQARYPVLIALFSIAAALYLKKLLENGEKRHATGFALCSVAILYTHYFGYFVVISFFLYSLLQLGRAINKKRLMISWGAIGLCALLWLPLVVRQFFLRESAGGGEHVPLSLIAPLVPVYFTTGFTDWHLPMFWPGLFTGKAVGDASIIVSAALALPACVLASIGLFSGEDEEKQNLLVSIWFGLSLMLFFAASLFVDIFKPYYLLPFLPPFVLLAGRGAALLVKQSKAAGIAVAAFAIIVPVGALTDYYNPKIVKEDWKSIAQILETQGQVGDVVLHYNFPSRTCLSYYYKGDILGRYVTEGHPGIHFVGEGMAEEAIGKLEKQYDRVWIVGYYPMRMDPAGLTLGYADLNLFKLDYESDLQSDPRFFLSLYALNEKALEKQYSQQVDFGQPDHMDSQVGKGFFPGDGPWRWIGDEAVVKLHRPDDATRLMVRGRANLDLLPAEHLLLVLGCNGADFGTMFVNRSGDFDSMLTLPGSCLVADTLSISLRPSHAFVPDEVLGDGDTSLKSVLIGRVSLEP